MQLNVVLSVSAEDRHCERQVDRQTCDIKIRHKDGFYMCVAALQCASIFTECCSAAMLSCAYPYSSNLTYQFLSTRFESALFVTYIGIFKSFA